MKAWNVIKTEPNPRTGARAAGPDLSQDPIWKELMIAIGCIPLLDPGSSSKLRQNVARQFVLLTKATSAKLQAATLCRIDTIYSGASICHIDRSSKQQASSFKPSLTSSLIREPRYMDTEKVFDALGPRAWAMINVLCGCFTWNAI